MPKGRGYPGYQTAMYKKVAVKRVATAKKHLSQAKKMLYHADGLKIGPSLFPPLQKGWQKKYRR